VLTTRRPLLLSEHWFQIQNSEAEADRLTSTSNRSPEEDLASTAVLSDVAPRVLVCSICDRNSIPAPPGSTANTRFFCRICIARLGRRWNQADGRSFAAAIARTRDLAIGRIARRRLIQAGVAKTHAQTDGQVLRFQQAL
jgi:hypothetical protein